MSWLNPEWVQDIRERLYENNMMDRPRVRREEPVKTPVFEAASTEIAPPPKREKIETRRIHADIPSKPLSDKKRNVRVIKLTSDETPPLSPQLAEEAFEDTPMLPGDELAVAEYDGPGGLARYFPDETIVTTSTEPKDIPAAVTEVFNRANYEARPFPMKFSDESDTNIAQVEVLKLARDYQRAGPITLEKAYGDYIFNSDKFMDERTMAKLKRLNTYLSDNSIDADQVFDTRAPESLKALMLHVHAFAYPEQAHDPNVARYTDTVLNDHFAEMDTYGEPNRPFPFKRGDEDPIREIKDLAHSLKFFEKNTLASAYDTYLSRSPFFMEAKDKYSDFDIAEYAAAQEISPDTPFDLNNPEQLIELMSHVHDVAYSQWSSEKDGDNIRATIRGTLFPDPQTNLALAPAQ